MFIIIKKKFADFTIFSLDKAKQLAILFAVLTIVSFLANQYFLSQRLNQGNLFYLEQFNKKTMAIESYFDSYNKLSKQIMLLNSDVLDKNSFILPEGLVAIAYKNNLVINDNTFSYLEEDEYKNQLFTHFNDSFIYFDEINLISSGQFSSSDFALLFYKQDSESDAILYVINKTYLSKMLDSFLSSKKELNSIFTFDTEPFLGSSNFSINKLFKNKNLFSKNKTNIMQTTVHIGLKNYILFIEKSSISNFFYAHLVPKNIFIPFFTMWQIFILLFFISTIFFILYIKYYPEVSTAKAIKEENKRSVLSVETMNQLLSTGKKEVALLSISIKDMHLLIKHYSAEELEDLFKNYTNRIYKAIHASRGLIESHSSESLRALWITQGTQSRPAKAAIESAIFMRESLNLFNNKLLSDGKIPLSFKIIISTGDAIVGQIATSSLPMVISPIINDINNLEVLTEEFPFDILITNAVFKVVGPFFITKPIDKKYALPPSYQLFSVERRLKDISVLKSINEPWSKHFSHLNKEVEDDK